MIDRISFKNFKLFKNWQTLELKPITILIGKNNTGKSAVAKLPTLIAGSLSGTFAQPFKSEYRGVKLGLSNSDLVYNKNTTTSLLGFKIENTKSKEILAVTIIGKDKPEFLEWSYNDEPISDFKKIKFKGFSNNKFIFKDLNITFDYIDAFRAKPQPNYTNNGDEFNSVGMNGENAYPILIQDYENKEGLAKKISDWYESHFEGWRLEVKKIDKQDPPIFQFVLSNQKIDSINIVHVGQGIHQVLPLIVRSYMPDDQAVLIIIEEPETHLHPAAHGDLAERFIDSFLENSNKHYLIETHSQNFILRIRRLVANKKLKIADLAIYYVDFDENKNESTLKKIEVDDLGGVAFWPEGIFSESLKEVIGIRNAQLNHLKHVD